MASAAPPDLPSPGHPLGSPDLYLQAAEFAAKAHLGQKLPGGELPYFTHVACVAAEVLHALAREPATNPDLAVVCALLHDTIEDCGVDETTIAALFGRPVADGVRALSKDPNLPKPEAMADSLRRIQQQPREVWLVKLADRINNLKDPPHYWTPAKISGYAAEARVIADALGSASPYLLARLHAKIAAYPHGG
jgi:(p)ppGpp synthase/HD superfamily hydrolase